MNCRGWSKWYLINKYFYILSHTFICIQLLNRHVTRVFAQLEFVVQMSCSSCVNTVKSVLEKEPGESSTTANTFLSSYSVLLGTFWVCYTPVHTDFVFKFFDIKCSIWTHFPTSLQIVSEMIHFECFFLSLSLKLLTVYFIYLFFDQCIKRSF